MANDTTEAPAAKPVARIVTDLPRDKTVPLKWPVEFDGKVYKDVKIRRISGKEVADYFEAVRGSTAKVMLPVIDCPVEVYDAMDAEDQFEVDKVGMDFLPPQFKAAVE